MYACGLDGRGLVQSCGSTFCVEEEVFLPSVAWTVHSRATVSSIHLAPSRLTIRAPS
jgi:hypothetical protein